MHYFATLNENTYACTGIMVIDDATYQENIAWGYEYENEFCIRIDFEDTSLVDTKKYINGEWVDCLPSETGKPVDTKMVHMPDDKWLNEAIGNTNDLATEAKGSLVAAINELAAKVAALENN